MTSESIKYKIASILIIIVLTLHLLSFYSNANNRNDQLPPGEHMPRIPWVLLPGADPFSLLCNNDAVRQDINLAPTQHNKLMDMEKFFRSELNELSHSEGREEAHAKINRHIEAAQDGIALILTKKQIDRLQEILLQMNGPCSLLSNSALMNHFSFTSKQKNELEEHCSRLIDKSKSMGPEVNIDSNNEVDHCRSIREKQKKMHKVIQSTNRRVFDILTEQQNKTYKELIGKKFKFNNSDRSACN